MDAYGAGSGSCGLQGRQRTGGAPTTTRLGWAIAGLALTSAAYATVPILQRALRLERGLQRIQEQHLGQEVDLRQIVAGFTVAVQRVYADANRIVIGYTVSGPADIAFNNFSPIDTVLTDQEGREYPTHSGIGAGMEGDTGGYVLSFDAGVLSQAPERLQLRLVTEIMGLPSTPVAQAPSPSISACGSSPAASWTRRRRSKRKALGSR